MRLCLADKYTYRHPRNNRLASSLSDRHEPEIQPPTALDSQFLLSGDPDIRLLYLQY